MRLSVADARLDARYLLEITFAGSVFWVCDGPDVEISREDGSTVNARGALSVGSFDDALELFADEAEVRQVGISFRLPVDVGLKRAHGYLIEGAPAALYRWREGQTVEAARCIVSGRLVEPVYNVGEDPVEASLEEHEQTSGATVPALDAVATSEATWDGSNVSDGTFDPAVEGFVYPRIIGRPAGWGVSLGGSAQTFGRGSPGLLVNRADGAGTWQHTRILVADTPIEAGTVYLWNATDSTKNFTGTVSSEPDVLGRTVATIAPTQASEVPDAGDELWIGWSGSGGMSNPFGPGELRGAGDVLRWALEVSGRRYDRGRLAAVGAYLNSWRIDCFLNTQIDPWEWARDEVLPLLPVSVVTGSRGLYLANIRPDATTADAVVWLEHGRNGHRDEQGISSSPISEVYNAFSLSYALAPHVGQHRKYRTLSPTRTPGDAWSMTSAACKRSASLFGRRVMESEATDVLVDDASALLTLRYWSLRYGFPRRYYGFVGGPDLDVAEVGDVARLDDVPAGFQDDAALVTSKSYTDGGAIRLGLTLFSSPLSVRLPA